MEPNIHQTMCFSEFSSLSDQLTYLINMFNPMSLASRWSRVATTAPTKPRKNIHTNVEKAMCLMSKIFTKVLFLFLKCLRSH